MENSNTVNIREILDALETMPRPNVNLKLGENQWDLLLWLGVQVGIMPFADTKELVEFLTSLLGKIDFDSPEPILESATVLEFEEVMSPLSDRRFETPLNKNEFVADSLGPYLQKFVTGREQDITRVAISLNAERYLDRQPSRNETFKLSKTLKSLADRGFVSRIDANKRKEQQRKTTHVRLTKQGVAACFSYWLDRAWEVLDRERQILEREHELYWLKSRFMIERHALRMEWVKYSEVQRRARDRVLPKEFRERIKKAREERAMASDEELREQLRETGGEVE